jgi:ABC-type dipeptide/oligopeptide/nickel transport system ATPase component
MLGGKIVETGGAEALFADPRRSFTKELPSLAPNVEQIGRRIEVVGEMS